MPTVKKILIEARGYILDPARWTKQVYARDANGESVPSTSPDATCWCALGALNKAVHNNGVSLTPFSDEVCDKLNRASFSLYGVHSSDVNDKLGHFEVLAIYARAIEEATE